MKTAVKMKYWLEEMIIRVKKQQMENSDLSRKYFGTGVPFEQEFIGEVVDASGSRGKVTYAEFSKFMAEDLKRSCELMFEGCAGESVQFNSDSRISADFGEFAALWETYGVLKWELARPGTTIETREFNEVLRLPRLVDGCLWGSRFKVPVQAELVWTPLFAEESLVREVQLLKLPYGNGYSVVVSNINGDVITSFVMKDYEEHQRLEIRATWINDNLSSEDEMSYVLTGSFDGSARTQIHENIG